MILQLPRLLQDADLPSTHTIRASYTDPSAPTYRVAQLVFKPIENLVQNSSSKTLGKYIFQCEIGEHRFAIQEKNNTFEVPSEFSDIYAEVQVYWKEVLSHFLDAYIMPKMQMRAIRDTLVR